MSDFSGYAATRVTERIMRAISPHLLAEAPPQENHHYNRVYEKVHASITTALGEIREDLNAALDIAGKPDPSETMTVLMARALLAARAVARRLHDNTDAQA